MTVNVEDMFGNAAYEFIDLIKAEPLVSVQEGHPMYDPERTKKATSLPAINPKQDPRKNRKNLSIGRSADAGEPNAASILRKRTGSASLPSFRTEERLVDKILSELSEEEVDGKKVPTKARVQLPNIKQLETKEEVDNRRAPAELVARLSSTREGEMAQDGPNKPAYDAKQRILKKAHEKRKKVDEEVVLDERVKLEAEYGNLLLVIVSWRGKAYQMTMFFPQPTMPTRKEVEAEIQKVYPGSRLMSYRITKTGDGKPILQVTNSKSKNYLLNNGTIGEQIEKDDQVEEGFKQADYVKMKRKEKKHADDAYKQGPDPQELSGKYRSNSRNRSFKMAGIRDAMMRGEDPRKDTRGGAYKKRGNPDEDHRANYSKNPLNNPKRRVKKPGVNQTANVDEDLQQVEEGLRRRLAAAGAAAAVAAGGGGAAKAGEFSGKANLRVGSTPAKATNKSVSSAVDKALANKGTSHSASSEKGKTGVAGSGSIKYSGSTGSSAKKKEKPEVRSTISPKPTSRPEQNSRPSSDRPSSDSGSGRARTLRMGDEYQGEMLEDWQSVNRKDKTDGLSQKAVDAYRRENPGSKLKTAVTGDPKPGSKDAKRRKSFCARSKGQQDMHNIDCSKTPDKPVCKARRRWKC